MYGPDHRKNSIYHKTGRKFNIKSSIFLLLLSSFGMIQRVGEKSGTWTK